MRRETCIEHLIGLKKPAIKECASHFAPVNIALVKYWGKRDALLNLPNTSSLSLTLSLGTHTKLATTDECDKVVLNGVTQTNTSQMYTRTCRFLDLFRLPGLYFEVDTVNEIPTGAGLASSASGFAALVLCLDDLFGWNLDKKQLSIIARLASGSASRSLYRGFVQWHKGIQEDGMDSFAEAINTSWPELCMGMQIVCSDKKPIDSRAAMQQTLETSHLYQKWPDQVACDLVKVREALTTKDFTLLGKTSEHNALSMHATMLSSLPSVMYFLPESCAAMHKVWQLRKEGLEVYFTMDAGPNLKILCLEKDRATLQKELPALEFVPPLF